MNPELKTLLERYGVDPARGELASVPPSQALVLVDLQRCAHSEPMAPPPVPVIGVGDPRHPLAPSLDCVVEPPVDLAALVRSIESAPHAAAVIVQLLRAIEGTPPDRALIVESFAYGLLQGSREFAAWLARQRSAPMSLGPPGRVHIEREGATLHVVMDRPAARNAIDRHMRDQLYEAFTVAASDETITCVKFRGIGTAFCAGADLTEFGTTVDPATAHLIRAFTLPAHAIARRAHIIDAHVHGPCVGAGVEMSAFAGKLTAAPQAWFQLPELTMGLLAGAGGCVSVPRRIGRQRAALMMLSGQRIDAQTALRWGLVDAIEHQPPVDQRGAHTL